ncbi:MAG TPA: TIGR04255 family protein [Polyangiaceae bacterium]|jgi:uncharacterized protein (TIGR04255 family)|nr:TIGR04255 family protein [Polyangiaceae bacterium]
MGENTPQARPLNIPAAEKAHFARNFIQLAVCELRFPTLFELEADRPPAALAKALRREYPNHDLLTNINVNPAGAALAKAHQFSSKSGRWKVTLRTAALSLETSHYDSFDDLETRLAHVVKAAAGTIDSDFFTRVGLRYINAVPYDPSTVGDWVNPLLVGALASGAYGDPQEFSQRTRGLTQIGGYSFQHGIGTSPSGELRYVLDFDLHQEDVPVADAVSVARKLHDLEFSMFMWSLGAQGRAHLGS